MWPLLIKCFDYALGVFVNAHERISVNLLSSKEVCLTEVPVCKLDLFIFVL